MGVVFCFYGVCVVLRVLLVESVLKCVWEFFKGCFWIVFVFKSVV